MITFPLLYVPNKDSVKGLNYLWFCLCFGDLFLENVSSFFFLNRRTGNRDSDQTKSVSKIHPTEYWNTKLTYRLECMQGAHLSQYCIWHCFQSNLDAA